MRAGKPLLAIATLVLHRCEPLTNDECYDPDFPPVVLIDLTGTWTGMARDAISMRYELRQAHWFTDAGRDEARHTGTVSITIPGPVEASDGEIDAGLIYNGPTAVTFDANGEVTGIELDSFTDTDFQLTRGDGEKTR